MRAGTPPTPYQSHLLQRALHLSTLEDVYGDDLNPLGWRLLDHAYESTLKDASLADCFEEVWDALFPPEDVRAVLHALRRGGGLRE